MKAILDKDTKVGLATRAVGAGMLYMASVAGLLYAAIWAAV